jgi:hypothetical protein
MATDACRTVIPALRLLEGPAVAAREVACHHAEEAVRVAV